MKLHRFPRMRPPKIDGVEYSVKNYTLQADIIQQIPRPRMPLVCLFEDIHQIPYYEFYFKGKMLPV